MYFYRVYQLKIVKNYCLQSKNAPKMQLFFNLPKTFQFSNAFLLWLHTKWGVTNAPRNVLDLLLIFPNGTPCTYHWRRLKDEFSSQFGFCQLNLCIHSEVFMKNFNDCFNSFVYPSVKKGTIMPSVSPWLSTRREQKWL